MKNKLPIILIVVAVIAVCILLAFVLATPQTTEIQQPLRGIRVGDQYLSTTTPQVAVATNLCPARVGMASSTTGVLGSVNVLKSGAGTLTIYDATTTNITLRGNTATSSLILVDFPTSATAGSYQFDIGFERGLLVDYTTAGTGVSSTTISYRCEG